LTLVLLSCPMLCLPRKSTLFPYTTLFRSKLKIKIVVRNMGRSEVLINMNRNIAQRFGHRFCQLYATAHAYKINIGGFPVQNQIANKTAHHIGLQLKSIGRFTDNLENGMS